MLVAVEGKAPDVAEVPGQSPSSPCLTLQPIPTVITISHYDLTLLPQTKQRKRHQRAPYCPLLYLGIGLSGTAVIVTPPWGGGGDGAGCASGACVKMVMYVVTTVGVGPGTSKMVVRMRVSTEGLSTRGGLFAGSFASGIHWEYHSLFRGHGQQRLLLCCLLRRHRQAGTRGVCTSSGRGTATYFSPSL